MGKFGNQLLLIDSTWSSRYNKHDNDRFNESSIDRTLASFKFYVQNYFIKVKYVQIKSTHADMWFSNITITHSIL